MILFNTTFLFPAERRAEFMARLRSEWLPAAVAAGMTSPLCAEVEQAQIPDMQSVALQGRFGSAEEARIFESEVAPGLIAGLTGLFGAERLLAFSTPMTIVEL